MDIRASRIIYEQEEKAFILLYMWHLSWVRWGVKLLDKELQTTNYCQVRESQTPPGMILLIIIQYGIVIDKTMCI